MDSTNNQACFIAKNGLAVPNSRRCRLCSLCSFSISGATPSSPPRHIGLFPPRSVDARSSKDNSCMQPNFVHDMHAYIKMWLNCSPCASYRVTKSHPASDALVQIYGRIVQNSRSAGPGDHVKATETSVFVVMLMILLFKGPPNH